MVAKLTPSEVREIRSLHRAGAMSWSQLGRTYGVTKSEIGHIVHRRTWKDIA
jgi:hypothetical protein